MRLYNRIDYRAASQVRSLSGVVMPEQAQQGYRDIFKKAVNEAKNFFRDSFDNAINGSANYLRDGNPTSVTGRAAQTINRRQCEVWGKDPTAFRPAWSEQLRDICGPYLEDKGLTPGDSSADSEFEGGQCAGLFYRAIGQLKWTIFIGSTGGVSNADEFVATELILRGPVGGSRAVYSNPGSVGPRDFVIEFDTVDGPVPTFFRTNPISTNSVSNARFEGRLELADGTTGGCGNPPPLYKPGTPYGPPLPPSPSLDPGNPLSPTIDVTVNPDGSIEICSGDQCITINPDGDGGVPVDDGNNDGGEIAPGDQGTPGDQQMNVDDVAEGQCEESNLVGVLVDTVVVPPRANRFFNSVESYSKGGYFVYFGGDSGFAQNPEAAISRSSQFYYAPEGCNRWRVVVNTGYRVNVTPFCKED